jgi:hypothetical protein
MTRSALRRHLSVVLLIGVLAGSATLIVAAGIPADDGYIYGCYGNATGDLRLVSSTEECRAQETGIAWNQVGPAGPEGPAGPAGPEGPAGPQGPSGVPEVFSTDQPLGVMTPILLTPTLQTIAKFSLPSGRYAIAASAQLSNESSYGVNALCGVFAGGRRFEAYDLVWGGNYESQAMTGVSTLSGVDTVTLMCRADTDGAVSVVAFSLTTTTLGAGGSTTTTSSTTGYTAGGNTTASTTTTTNGTTGTGTTTGGTGSTTGTSTTTAGTTGTTTTGGTTGGTTGSTGTSTGTSGTSTGTTTGTTGTTGTTTTSGG